MVHALLKIAEREGGTQVIIQCHYLVSFNQIETIKY